MFKNMFGNNKPGQDHIWIGLPGDYYFRSY